MALSLIAGLLQIGSAHAAPAISFINPSTYDNTTTLQLSDKPDSDGAYHLVAWVQQVPANPIVEFELQSTGQNAETINATRVGSSDTWEAFFDIPAPDSDGPYALRARLYSGGTEVANDEEAVTINNSQEPPAPPTAAETLEITYPANGGSFGFFTPKGKATNGVVVVKASSGTKQARVFYTQSDPGNDPNWKPCGFGTVNQTTFTARVRCELKDGDTPASVSAVAAVANRTPAQTDPNAGLDDTGDAHRIAPYVQQPTSFSLSPQAQSSDPDKCTPLTVATLLDQAGQPIAQANVDIHAIGPSDQLRFGEMGTETSGFQPPDKAHLSKEFAIKCGDDSNSAINQGDHNVPGGDDIKHIESVTGTSNSGQFGFMLHGDEVGSTTFTIWADVDDDDLPGSSEASGGGRIGWGQPPPPPVAGVTLTPADSTSAQGDCQKVTLTATEDGTPVAGKNVDLHAFGPDSSLAFCDPGTGMPRPPDQGGHTGYTHPDGTIHGEGETDGSGHLVVGLTSGTVGNSALTAWLDRTDDDAQGTDEPSTSGQITWKEAGHRSVSLRSNKSPVQAGTKVRLSGRVSGDDSCTGAQTVKLKSRKHGGGKFKGAGTATTSSTGKFKFNKKVKRSTDYRAVAPRAGSCSKAKSKVVTVRAA
jgi:hypothetical protein